MRQRRRGARGRRGREKEQREGRRRERRADPVVVEARRNVGQGGERSRASERARVYMWEGEEACVEESERAGR